VDVEGALLQVDLGADGAGAGSSSNGAGVAPGHSVHLHWDDRAVHALGGA